MTPILHRKLVAIADGIAPDLARDIASVGPLGFPDRKERGIAAFLARAVVGQQLSAQAARSIWARVEAASGGDLGAFCCETNQAALLACGLSRSKIKTLIGIGAAERGGELAVERLAALDHAARAAQLTQLWGIGPWTCDMLSIFYFHEPDIWPVGDLAVQRVFRRYIGRRKPERAARAFQPYRSVLALYLWRLVDRR